jgi:hypothetical protein
MPVNCDPSSLANAARCFASCIPPGEFEAVKVYLICEYANKSTGPATPGSLDVSDPSVAGNTILTWTNSDLPTTNEIWKSTDGVTFAFLSSVSGNVHTFTDTAAMANNVFFYYKVRATTGGVSSNFSNTVSVSNNINMSGSALTSFSFPTLVIAYGSFDVSSSVAAASATFTLLRKVTGLFNLSSCPAITTLSLPALVSIGDNFLFANIGVVNQVFPSLQAVVGPFMDFDSCAALVTISFPAMTSVNSIDGSNCPLMTTLTFGAGVTVGGDLTIGGGFAGTLSNLSMPNSIFADGHSLDFTSQNIPAGNSLNGTGVNGILRRLVLSGVTTDTVDFTGGTSAGFAALSAQGQADYTALNLAGNSVSLNP